MSRTRTASPHHSRDSPDEALYEGFSAFRSNEALYEDSRAAIEYSHGSYVTIIYQYYVLRLRLVCDSWAV